MGKVLCDYCKEWMEATDENCPNCGAANKNYARVTKGTPKTIEELQSWYKARNLPPEETTRFFIGKDIREPRAFGIYEHNGIFTVYKNKANGQRVVRYEGEDEAYAVKELYLRLKEEILNQKNINQQRRSIGNNFSHPAKRKRKNKLISFLTQFLIMVFFLSIFIVPFSISMVKQSKESKSNDYYLDKQNNLYYCNWNYQNGYEWWLYDKENEVWKLSTTTESKNPINGMTNKENHYDFLIDTMSILAPDMDVVEFDKKYNIYKSREFIDAGNHYEPKQGYYKSGDDFYYYLNDAYGNSYGTRDNSGWYKLVDNDWEYYCTFDDKDAIGESLWYADDDYYLASSYYMLGSNSYDFENYKWNITNFENTEWYEETKAAESAYDKYVSEHKNDHNDWDNDNDWDWDSNDTWDSGGTDWDSDW